MEDLEVSVPEVVDLEVAVEVVADLEVEGVNKGVGCTNHNGITRIYVHLKKISMYLTLQLLTGLHMRWINTADQKKLQSTVMLQTQFRILAKPVSPTM